MDSEITNEVVLAGLSIMILNLKGQFVMVLAVTPDLNVWN